MQQEILKVNSKSYWDQRFGSGDWEIKGGYSQTRLFAESQIRHIDLGPSFDGTLCDFGCGAGDAFPIYTREFPAAKLVGVDFSEDAIGLCTERYGSIADFRCVDSKEVPLSDVIICSNVLEHIEDHTAVLQDLLHRCSILYVIVPYREHPLSHEHVRAYDDQSFSSFSPISKKVFTSKGWSKFGLDLWYRIHLKNIGRMLLGRPILRQPKQIVFKFKGQIPPEGHSTNF